MPGLVGNCDAAPKVYTVKPRPYSDIPGFLVRPDRKGDRLLAHLDTPRAVSAAQNEGGSVNTPPPSSLSSIEAGYFFHALDLKSLKAAFKRFSISSVSSFFSARSCRRSATEPST